MNGKRYEFDELKISDTDMMKSVDEFHRVFEFPDPPSPPAVPDLDSFASNELLHAAHWLQSAERALKKASKDYEKPPLCLLLAQLMVSEVSETLVAMARGDVVGVLDGGCDSLYVVLGTLRALGLRDVTNEAFNRVHASNMSKVGPDGKVHRDETGKVIKGDWYKPVRLEDLVE